MSFVTFAFISVFLCVSSHLLYYKYPPKKPTLIKEITSNLIWSTVICFGYPLLDMYWGTQYDYFEGFFLWCLYSLLIAIAINCFIFLFYNRMLK